MPRKKKQSQGLSAEGEAKAQAWIRQQREVAEAWKTVERVSRLSGGSLNILHNLARALLDLREKLEKHENEPAEDDVCPHGGC